jgi:hypothetical protein
MSTQSPKPIPELAVSISRKIEKAYLECTIEQQNFIRNAFNQENGSQLQNMNGDLSAWLANQDPNKVLRHFSRLRCLILLTPRSMERTVRLG